MGLCVCVCVCWGGMHLRVRDCPGGPEAKAHAYNAGDPWFDPWSGN